MENQRRICSHFRDDSCDCTKHQLLRLHQTPSKSRAIHDSCVWAYCAVVSSHNLIWWKSSRSFIQFSMLDMHSMYIYTYTLISVRYIMIIVESFMYIATPKKDTAKSFWNAGEWMLHFGGYYTLTIYWFYEKTAGIPSSEPAPEKFSSVPFSLSRWERSERPGPGDGPNSSA